MCYDSELVSAVKDALHWFSTFGYNSYGIACKDDFEDHVNVEIRLREALADHINSAGQSI